MFTLTFINHDFSIHFRISHFIYNILSIIVFVILWCICMYNLGIYKIFVHTLIQISMNMVAELFPYNIAFDTNLVILSIGSSLARIFPVEGCQQRIDELFAIKRPPVKFNFETVITMYHSPPRCMRYKCCWYRLNRLLYLYIYIYMCGENMLTFEFGTVFSPLAIHN